MPSAPGGLQSLGKDSSSKISGTSTSDKHDKRSEKSLVLPPEVSATLEAILESNADGHLDVSSSTVRKLAVQSPFSAANGIDETKGRPLKFALTAQYGEPSQQLTPFKSHSLCNISFLGAREQDLLMLQLSCVAPLQCHNLSRDLRARSERDSLCKQEQGITHLLVRMHGIVSQSSQNVSRRHGPRCASGS